MKKIFTLSTGIVFLITILIAGGCKSAKDNKAKKVEIYLSSVEVNGEIHLYMKDSNGNEATDSLRTEVKAGGTVIWRIERPGGIKKIDGIYSKGERNIFKKDPSKIFLSKRFRLKLSDDAEGEEKYSIEYYLEDNTKKTIDPFLRIPPID